MSISGNSNTVNIVGDVNMSADYAPDSKITSNTPLTGVSISGNNNTIALDGKLNIDVNDRHGQWAVSERYWPERDWRR